eukprot:6196627-Pleurochrysis_carterae.AAC.3
MLARNCTQCYLAVFATSTFKGLDDHSETSCSMQFSIARIRMSAMRFAAGNALKHTLRGAIQRHDAFTCRPSELDMFDRAHIIWLESTGWLFLWPRPASISAATHDCTLLIAHASLPAGLRTRLCSSMHRCVPTQLMYLDVNRTTLEVLDIGQAIKHVFTPKKELHNTLIPADASSADVYAILDDYATLNNNIRADQPTPREVSLSDCEAFPEWCGLYAHCGSSYSMKHGHSYASPTTGGVKVDGVGFEDNVAFIAHEGSQGEGGIAGTVQTHLERLAPKQEEQYHAHAEREKNTEGPAH